MPVPGNVESWFMQPSIAVSIASGIIVHIIAHFQPPASLTAFALVSLLVPAGLFYYSSQLSQPAWPSIMAPAIYLCSLACSITAYRLSPFHPLARYPGPVLARVSRLWALWGVVRGRQHLEYHELFERYGDVVRTGPDHLIMRDASAIPAIHGSKDRWPRHARYQVHLPLGAREALLELHDVAEHSKRRRLWDRAFSPTAIKSYEPMLQARLGQLLDALSARVDQAIDLHLWISFFTLDFMGDFAFGGMFEYLKHGSDYDGVHKLIGSLASVVELFGTVPWIRPFMSVLTPPKVLQLKRLCVEVAAKRVAEGSSVRDLFYYLLSEDGEEDAVHESLSPDDLSSEAMLAIGAGSDTSSTAILNCVFHLLTHPAVFLRVREEIDQACGNSTAFDQLVEAEKLVELKYLQVVINETLRLLPLGPSGMQRTWLGERETVLASKYVIPSGTSVQLSTWSIHRDPRYFYPHPDTFWPERWLPDEGLKAAEALGQDFRLSQAAYMPFHYGPTNCAGRALALHELRTVLAALVRRFDIAFAPGFEGKDWVDQFRDRFLLLTGEMKVVLSPRA